jgi:hypothetical protein
LINSDSSRSLAVPDRLLLSAIPVKVDIAAPVPGPSDEPVTVAFAEGGFTETPHSSKTVSPRLGQAAKLDGTLAVSVVLKEIPSVRSLNVIVAPGVVTTAQAA